MGRYPAWALTLTLLGVGVCGANPSPQTVPPRDAGVAPVWRTYTDAAHGYALRYPRPWTLQTGVPTPSFHAGLDALAPCAVIFVSPDTDVGLIAVAGRATYSQARIIRTETRVLSADPGQTRQGSITFGARVIGGVVFRDARATFTTRAGAVEDRALMATRHGWTHLFVVVLTPGGAHTAVDRAETHAVVARITVRP